MIDSESEESWLQAKAIASQLEPIPQSVSYAVQALWQNHTDNIKSNQSTISEASFESVRRMDKTSKLKTPMYFAAQSLYPERFELSEDDTSKALIRVLHPGLFAAILALVYLHRRLNKICTADQWNTLSKEMVLNMELGFLLGSSIPQVSPALGTLLGGIRYAALGAMLKKSPEQYSKYRNLRKNRFDLEDEHTRWECDHAQVAAFLLQHLGFRKDFVDTGFAMRAVDKGLERLPEELRLWRAIVLMLDAAKEGNTTLANPALSSILKLSPANLENFKSKLNELLRSGSTFSWMFKSTGES
jgi:hypothetical protein